MDDLMDLIMTNDSPADISDKIKELLFTKSAEKIETVRPMVSASMFETEEDSQDEEE